MKTLISNLIFTCLLLPVFGLAQTNPQFITAYTDNFSGNYYELGPGQYDFEYLAQSGLSSIRSVKVPEGMKVVLFSEDDFKGYSVVLLEDATSRFLDAKGFNQPAMTMSMRVEVLPAGTPTIKNPFATIFRDNFSGPSKRLVPGYYESHDFGHIENDQISSVIVPKGLQVTIYSDKNFAGKSLVLTQDATSEILAKNGLHDAISSLRVELQAAEPEKKVVQPQPTPVPQPVAEVKDDKPATMVTIYSGDFAGTSMKLKPGSYKPGTFNVDDDDVSSIKVPKGYRVTLYDGDSFNGKGLWLVERDADQAYFERNSFNDITSSILVEAIPQVSLFENDFSEPVYAFKTGNYYAEDLKSADNSISSVKVPKGMWVILFDGNRYQGKSLMLTSDADLNFLKSRGFDNITSSIMVGDDETPPPMVTIYQDDFSGPSKNLAPGIYEFQDLEIGNNAISSVKIPKGMRVTMFEYGGLEGRSMLIRKSVDTEFLKGHQFNDLTSSMMVEMIDPENLVVTIYSGSYAGASQTLSPGRYQSSDIQIGEREISSLRVPPGMRATLYEGGDFRGMNYTAERNTDFTGAVRDNRYSAIIVEDIFEPIVSPVPAPVAPPVPTPQPVVKVDTVKALPVVVPKPVVVECKLTQNEYNNALRAIRAESFSQDKLRVSLLATKDKCLTNEQVRAIMKLLEWDDPAMEFAQAKYELATDKSTYYTLQDVFAFSSSKERFLSFLDSK